MVIFSVEAAVGFKFGVVVFILVVDVMIVVVVIVVVDVVVDVVIDVVVDVVVDVVLDVVVDVVVDVVLVIFVGAGRGEVVEICLILFFNFRRLIATGLFELANFVFDVSSDFGIFDFSPGSCKLSISLLGIGLSMDSK